MGIFSHLRIGFDVLSTSIQRPFLSGMLWIKLYAFSICRYRIIYMHIKCNKIHGVSPEQIWYDEFVRTCGIAEKKYSKGNLYKCIEI